MLISHIVIIFSYKINDDAIVVSIMQLKKLSDYSKLFFNLSKQKESEIIIHFLKNKTEIDLLNPDLKYEFLKFGFDTLNIQELNPQITKALNERKLNTEDLFQLDQQTFFNKLIYTNDIDNITPIEYVSKKSNCIFIHEFANEISSDDKMLKNIGYLNYENQLKMILSVQGDISTSTHLLSRGVSSEYDYTRSRMGVILSSGIATTGSVSDTYSYINKNNERVTNKGKTKMIDIIKSITMRSKNSYNEITVKSPEIAGLYFNFDSGRTNNADTIGNFFTPYSLYNTLSSFQKNSNITLNDESIIKLDIFALIDGKIRHLNFNAKNFTEFCEINNSGRAMAFSHTKEGDQIINDKVSQWKKLNNLEMLEVLGIGDELSIDELYKKGKIVNSLTIEIKKSLFDDIKNSIKKDSIREFYEKKLKNEVNLNNFKNKLIKLINKTTEDNSMTSKKKQSFKLK